MNKTPSDANETFASTNNTLAAFANDTGPAADAIKELLKNPSKDAADDPALAAILAEEMAKAFNKEEEPEVFDLFNKDWSRK